MPRLSVKSLILSNLTHWGAFVFGLIGWMVIYYAGATIATDGASIKSIIDEMNASISLDAASLVVGLLAPLLAGYVGAKFAPAAKLTHGALATSSWLLFAVYSAIWGHGSTDSHVQLPEWLDLAVSYGAPLPALLGARLYLRRQQRMPETPATSWDQSDFAPQTTTRAPARPETPAIESKRSVGRAGSVIGTFVALIVTLLLTRHEKSMLLLAVVGATVITVVFVYAEKKFKSMRS